jgi:hypothetical protein
MPKRIFGAMAPIAFSSTDGNDICSLQENISVNKSDVQV